ncbi:MAG: hypothetical protein ACRD35_07335 [Candidatus Acidiferrales bacterium]
MNQKAYNELETLPLRVREKRHFGRFRLPVSVLIEVRWKGRLLPLADAPDLEDIGAMGAAFCLAQGPLPPVGAQLEIAIPLRAEGREARLCACCRGRVVRHDRPNRVAVYFEDIEFVPEDRPAQPAEARARSRVSA